MSKIAKKYLAFDIYEQSEVDTISGVLQTNIDTKTPKEDWNQNGFENRTDSTMSFDDGTRTLTLTKVNDFSYWIAGVKYTKTANDPVVIDDTEGIHAIYYDGSTLTALANPTAAQYHAAILTKALVCILYWDTSASEAIYVGEERHGKTMSPSTHNYLHFTVGMTYLSGLGLNTMDVDGSGNDATAAQFGVDAGSVADEDIHLSPAAVAAATALPIYYMLGASAEWQRLVTAGYSVRTFSGDNTTRLAWNEYTGGAWQLTQAASNQFVLCHVFATTEKDKPMIAIMGQATYGNKTAARAGARTEIKSLILDDILFPEIRPIATIIYQTANAYTNNVKGRVVSTTDGDNYVDWRDETVSRVALTTSDHNDLSGLQGGTADEYYHLTSAQHTDLTDGGETSLHIHDGRYYTESEVTTISGDLQTNIDAKDNYASWSFAVDGVTKDAITSGDVLDFVGGDNITITRSADDKITISGGAGGGTSDHGELDGLADDDHEQYLKADGTRQLTGTWNIGNYMMGINTVPSYPLHLDHAPGAGNFYQIYAHMTPSGTLETWSGYYGLFVDIDSDADENGFTSAIHGANINVMSTGDISALAGLFNVVSHNSGESITSLHGEYSRGQLLDGHVTDLYGGETKAYLFLGGAADNAHGYRTGVQMGAAGETLGTAYGYSTYVTRSNGTITTGYLFHGIYSGTIGTKWGIYLDGEEKNYFSGNVGIGTTSPGKTLEVNGTVSGTHFYGDGSNLTGIGASADHGELDGLADDDHEQYLLANGNRQLTGTWNYGSQTISGTGDIYTSGNVGVGTTTPSGKLHVAGSHIYADMGYGFMSRDTNSNLAGMYVNTDDSVRLVTNSTPRLIISENGYVGIGVIAPAHGLDVQPTFGLWNSGETKGFVQAWQTNYTSWAFYNGSGWTYPLGVADTKSNLGAVSFYDGWIGIGNLNFSTMEACNGTNINEFSTDGTLAGDSDNAVPTEKAVKTYVDTVSGSILTNVVEDTTPQLGGDLDMNGKGIDFPTTPNVTDVLDEDEMDSDSATKLATQQSIKAYVDSFMTESPITKIHAYADVVNQTITTATWTKVTLGAKEYDTLGEFDDVTNSRFTCTVAGYYHIVGQVSGAEITVDGERQIMRIYKNGSATKLSQDLSWGAITYSATHVTGVLKLEVDDEIELWFYTTHGSDFDIVNIAGDTLLQIHQLPTAQGAVLNTSKYVKVTHTESAGTAGGTFTQDAWQTRPLNTEDNDPDGVCTLSSNQITLAAGTYECRIAATAFFVDRNVARLRNVTGGTTVLAGIPAIAGVTGVDQSQALIMGRFTIAASQALEVQHRCYTTNADDGFGYAGNYGEDEVYTVAEFWKIYEGGAQEGVGFNSRASAYANAAQDIPNDSSTKVELDTEEFDGLGEFDNITNYRFTANTAGYYMVAAQIRWNETIDDGKKSMARIYKNGAVIASCEMTTGTGTTLGLPVSKIVYLAATEYLELYAYHNHGVARQLKAGNEWNFMTVHRLS